MIASITVSSGLVPLIEGPCAQIYKLRFEIIGGLRSHLLLFFFGRKNMLKEKDTYECMLTLRKNAYGLVHVRLCNGAEASLPWKLLQNYLESCASIVQAAVCRPPPAGSTLFA